MNNNKVALLNGQKVNIVSDVSEADDSDDVIEVKSVKYRELVRQSKHVSDDDEDSGRIRNTNTNMLLKHKSRGSNFLLSFIVYN